MPLVLFVFAAAALHGTRVRGGSAGLYRRPATLIIPASHQVTPSATRNLSIGSPAATQGVIKQACVCKFYSFIAQMCTLPKGILMRQGATNLHLTGVFTTHLQQTALIPLVHKTW